MAPSVDTVTPVESSWITDEFLHDILKVKLPDTNVITVVNKVIKRAVGKAENYLSVLYRIEVQYKEEESDVVEEAHLIVKALPEGEFIKNLVHKMGVFVRELHIYHTVLPELHMFSQDRLKRNYISDLTAVCYKTTRKDTLVLEDLLHQGFLMANRQKRLDMKHCQLVLKSMAKLHAVSAARHQHNPEILSNYGEVMWCEKNKDNLGRFIPLLVESIAKTSQKWEGVENISAKITRLVPNVLDKLYEVTRLQKDGFNVLTHGDSWVNNVLFKYSSSKEPTDIRFVDFQLSRLGSPALDLSYFIYSSPQNEVRDFYLEDLLQTYYRQFSDNMKMLGGDVTQFTYNDLKGEMNRTAFFGFVASIMTLGVMLTQADDIPDMKDIKEEDVDTEGVNFFNKTHNAAAYREAFEPLLFYFDKLGIFD